jgi:hypothetical protein
MKPSLLALSSCLVLVGCVLPPPEATTPGQPAAGQPAAETAVAAGGLSCVAVLDCSGACGTDETCILGCQGAGSAAAQPKVSALLDCAIDVCGNDSDCVATSCRGQLDSCVADGAVAAAPTGEVPAATSSSGKVAPVANADILPWLVGEWIGSNHQFTFHADGRVRRASGIALYTDKGEYGCASIVNDIGTVVQEGDVLVMTFGTSEENHCGSKSDAPALVVRYRIDWIDPPYSDDPNLVLVLRDLGCPAGQGMYCDNRMRRR